MMVCVSYATKAQDTISGAVVNSGYFYRNGFHITESMYPLEIGHSAGFTCGEFYVRCIPDDTITVYGVAAIFGNPKEWGDWWSHAADTTEASANSTFYLAVPSGDTIDRVSFVKLNPYTTPTSYFITFTNPPYSSNPGGVSWSTDRLWFERMIEQPFNRPVTLADTFYLGRTCYGSCSVPHNGGYAEQYFEAFFGDVRLPKDTYDYVAYYFHENPRSVNYNSCPWHPNGRSQFYTIMYPILTKDSTWHFNGNDTTITDTVVTSIERLVDRMTSVSPNPVSGRMKVVSSFGIEKVEVYNMAGGMVATLLPERRSTRTLTLTASTVSWPVGTYLLRIHTPLGVATKKVSVVR